MVWDPSAQPVLAVREMQGLRGDICSDQRQHMVVTVARQRDRKQKADANFSHIH